MKPALFDFNGAAVRVINNESGIWFISSDVCRVLDIGNTSMAMSRLDDEDRGIISTDTLGGLQTVSAVNESGLYSLILGSRKPEARTFKKWVTREVLPAIRQTGAYSVAPQLPQSYSAALRELADSHEQLTSARLQLADAAPKVEFHDAVTASSDVVVMAVAAQTAKLPFGSNTLFRKLREMGVLISGGQRHNLPKQRYIEQGLFVVNEFKYEHKSGEAGVSFTTHVTQKGIAWLVEKFSKEVAA